MSALPTICVLEDDVSNPGRVGGTPGPEPGPTIHNIRQSSATILRENECLPRKSRMTPGSG